MNLSKEEQLILTFSRLRLSESDAHRINKLLFEPLDWDMVQQHADYHRLSPLIYYHLKKLINRTNSGELSANSAQLPNNAITQLPNDVIPSGTIEFFKQAYYENLARNLTLFQELREVLQGLNHLGIPVIVLKGALWAEMLYKNPALRVIGDIDLLVRPGDFQRAADYLLELGYSRSDSVEDVVKESYSHDIEFVKDKGISVVVELHKEVTAPGRFKVNGARIWKDSVPIKLAGVDALRLSDEDLILHLCFHLACHKFLGLLSWWADLSELIEKFRSEIHWNYIVERAIEQRIKTPVYVSFYFVQKIMNTEIPSTVLKAVEPNPLRRKIIFLFLDENKLTVRSDLYDRLMDRSRKYRLMLGFLLIDKIEDRLFYSTRFILRSLELIFSRILFRLGLASYQFLSPKVPRNL